MMLLILSLSSMIAMGGILFSFYDSGFGFKTQNSRKKEVEKKYQEAYTKTNDLIRLISESYTPEEMKQKKVSKQVSLWGVYEMLVGYKADFSDEEIKRIWNSSISIKEFERHVESYDDHMERLQQFEIYYHNALHIKTTAFAA